ncbi:MAG: hemerythrin family protein [Hyphomicrobiales bacterium]|nr:hemerythrin family protein [Hyphomicrobiales bacterium]
MTITWRAEMSVGDTFIDEDHRHLIEIVNLYEQAVKNRDPQKLEECFEELMHYAAEHFAREERVMAAIDYPELAHHAESHKRLAKTITDIHEAVASGKKGVIKLSQINTILHDWIVDHILKEDMALKPYLARANSREEDRVLI